MIPEIVDKKRHSYFLLTGFAGLVSLYWAIFAYRLTFISLWTLLAIIGLSAVLATLLNYRQYGATYKLKGLQSLCIALCSNVVGWGFIVCSAFILSNYYLPHKNASRKEFEIISRRALPGGENAEGGVKSAYTIRYKGLEKELVFEPRFYKWKDDYKSVILSMEEGFWGFEVIRSKALTK